MLAKLQPLNSYQIHHACNLHCSLNLYFWDTLSGHLKTIFCFDFKVACDPFLSNVADLNSIRIDVEEATRHGLDEQTQRKIMEGLDEEFEAYRYTFN